MKRAAVTIAALALVLGLSGAALAQDDAPPAKGDKAFKMLDANGDGKVTKEEFLAASQKRAEARYAKLDPEGKGYLTKDDFAQAREKAREKAKARKAKAAGAAPAAQ
ncbi:MAG: EF-hand domain-containing protein [Thermodesulfobacteriota bacterium]